MTKANDENALLKRKLAAMEKEMEMFRKALSRPSTSVDNRSVVDDTYSDEGATVVIDMKKVFHKMSTRQHAVMQMLLGNSKNSEIAERFGVTESGAKTYITMIYKKLGIIKTGPHNKRLWAQDLITPYFSKISEEEYKSMSRIPKSWHRDYAKHGKTYRKIVEES